MQHHEGMKAALFDLRRWNTIAIRFKDGGNEGMNAASFDLRLQDVSQQEAASLAEALERWLDDGGPPGNEAASSVGGEGFSSLQFVKPQGG
jgi:hypothetical protein